MMADILGRENIRLYIEDARKRIWFGNTGRERLKGAGSICRDSTIWDDFCKELGVEYVMVDPEVQHDEIEGCSVQGDHGMAG